MKEEKRKLDVHLLKTELNPELLAKVEINPEAKSRLFEGRSPIAREYYERDVARIRESFRIDKAEPKFQMKHDMMIKGIDLRTGKADVSQLLPGHVQIKDPRIPDHPMNSVHDLPMRVNPHQDPEKTLSAAMKRLNEKKLE